MTVRIPFADGPAERTLLIRRRGEGIASAVRGYAAGTLQLGGERCPAVLTDGDGDGCFDGAADRLGIDRDRDGRIDPLTEQYPVGQPIPGGAAGFLVRPDPSGLRVAVAARPTETGTLAVEISRTRGAEVAGLSAEFLSDDGELIAITEEYAPKAVPVGRYRLRKLDLRLTDAEGRQWWYAFWGDKAKPVAVERRGAARIDLTAGVRMSVALPNAAPREAEVAPSVTTAAGLLMTGCEVREKFADWGREATADLRLMAPGSETLAEAPTCFRCGRLGATWLRVGADWSEATATFPSGPLAGELRGWKEAPR